MANRTGRTNKSRGKAHAFLWFNRAAVTTVFAKAGLALFIAVTTVLAKAGLAVFIGGCFCFTVVAIIMKGVFLVTHKLYTRPERTNVNVYRANRD
jgi:hypothetical protein